MKLLKNVEKIFNKKYQVFVLPDDKSGVIHKNIYKYIEANPEEKLKFIHCKNNQFYNEKYKNNITKGYYGFDINILPENWLNIIDELLELFIKNDPEFEIHQIKIKFGGVRFYVVSKVIEDLFEINELIESKLHSQFLMY